MELDSSPSKRRKISSTASIAVASKNGDGNFQPRKDDHPRSSISSFMSPTKASLARFHPALLPSPKPTSRAIVDSLDRRRKSLSPQRLDAPALGPSARAATASPVRRGAVGGGAADAGTTESPLLGKDLGAGRRSRGLPTSKEHRSSGLSDRDAEPDLPPTPEQLGLEHRSDPPRGLSSSSPLKPKSLRRAGGVGSSPLKPKRNPPESTPDRPPNEAPENATQQVLELEERRKEAEICARARKQKQKLLDQVAEQCQRVRSDISSLKQCVKDGALPDGLEPQTAYDAFSIIISSNPSHKPLPPPRRTVPTSTKLASFLPFTKPRISQSLNLRNQPTPFSYAPVNLLDTPEHRTAFTPFTLSSTKILSASHSEGDPMEAHLIELQSPKGLLAVELRVVSNVTSGVVDSVEVTRVAPWANAELGQWLRAQALTGDVSSMGWACGRYWEVACLRAKHWLRCQALFPNLFHGAEDADENPFTLHEDRPPEGTSDLSVPLSRRALFLNLGRQSLQLTRDRVSLLFSWWIEMDGSGEVRSEADVSASYPKVWDIADERGSFKQLKATFHRLHERDGVLEATRIVTEIVFQD